MNPTYEEMKKLVEEALSSLQEKGVNTVLIAASTPNGHYVHYSESSLLMEGLANRAVTVVSDAHRASFACIKK